MVVQNLFLSSLYYIQGKVSIIVVVIIIPLKVFTADYLLILSSHSSFLFCVNRLSEVFNVVN